jgi:hypothetical protein
VEDAVSTAVSWQASDSRPGDVLERLAQFREAVACDPERSLTGVVNLIAVAEHPGERAALEELLIDLGHHQPSRTIVLAVDPSRDGLDVSVDADCLPVPDARQRVSVERIGLTMGGTRSAAALMVAPLLRSCLTTVLWWPGVPASDDDGAAELMHLADRVVTEGERLADPAAALARLRGLIDADGPVVTDLAWPAITCWRRAVSQALDHPSWERLRAGPARLELRAGGGGAGLGGALLAGWLRELIGAHLEIAAAPDPRPDPICGLRLEGASGDRLTISSHPGRPTAEVSTVRPGSASRRRTAPLSRPGRGELLLEELGLHGRDPSFERALARGDMVAP